MYSYIGKPKTMRRNNYMWALVAKMQKSNNYT